MHAFQNKFHFNCDKVTVHGTTANNLNRGETVKHFISVWQCENCHLDIYLKFQYLPLFNSNSHTLGINIPLDF